MPPWLDAKVMQNFSRLCRDYDTVAEKQQFLFSKLTKPIELKMSKKCNIFQKIKRIEVFPLIDKRH